MNGSLADTFRGIEAQAEHPEWIGYSVAEIAGDRTVCCGNFNDGYGSCGTCRLEKKTASRVRLPGILHKKEPWNWKVRASLWCCFGWKASR